MQQIIINNARYWLTRLEGRPLEDRLSDAQLRSAVLALEAAITLPGAWDVARDLTFCLHVRVEQAGHWRDWEHYMREMLRLAQQRGDFEAEIRFLLSLGDLQRRKGEGYPAIEAYRHAWRIAKTHDLRLPQAVALANLSELYVEQGVQGRAEALGKLALQRLEGQHHPSIEAQVHNFMGWVYVELHAWEQADYYLGKALAIARASHNLHNEALILHNLNTLYHRQERWELAEECLRQALALYQQLNDPDRLAQMQLNLGNLHLRLKNYEQAEVAYLQAEKAFRELGNRLNLARTHHNLGMIYTRLERWDEAERCFEQACAYWSSHENWWNYGNTLDDWAGLNIARGRISQAIEQLDLAWSLARNQHDARYQRLQGYLSAKRRQLGLACD